MPRVSLMVTCLGDAFAGRVAASLVHGAGLADLVTTDLEQYHALALKLAREPALLAGTKARLAPLDPMPRNETPCVVGFAVRLLLRRNSSKPMPVRTK